MRLHIKRAPPKHVCVCHAACTDLFDGLNPILEAVSELTAAGQPIPSSARTLVQQFLERKLDVTIAAAGSTAEAANARTSAPNVQGVPVGPPDLECLTILVNTTWRPVGQEVDPKPLMHVAVQLMTDAVYATVQQRQLLMNSAAYKLLYIVVHVAGEKCLDWLDHHHEHALCVSPCKKSGSVGSCMPLSETSARQRCRMAAHTTTKHQHRSRLTVSQRRQTHSTMATDMSRQKALMYAMSCTHDPSLADLETAHVCLCLQASWRFTVRP